MNRNIAIDFFRGIAALLVVFAHGKFILQSKSAEFLGWGAYWGVELFFIISGYLLVPQINKIIHYGFLSDVKVFFLRRIGKIIPCYYLFVFISVYLYEIPHIFPYLIFSHGVAPKNFPESWSLQVEEIFYFFLTFLSLVSLYGFKVRISLILFIVILLSPFIRFLFFSDFDDSYDSGIRKNAFFRIDSLAIGGIIGLYSREIRNIKSFVGGGLIFLFLIAFIGKLYSINSLVGIFFL